MIFSILMIVVVLLVAFWHHLQGFFSSAISVILAAVSVLLAFSYYEPLIHTMKPGKFADSAHGMMLIVLYAVIYLVLRVIFDKFVPGNVRVPAIVDKAGGGILGVIAGVLTAGVIAVAAQALPFGPSIGGYTRYPVKGESMPILNVAEGSQQLQRTVYDELAADSFDKTRPTGLILPVDDMVVGFVQRSSSGSTSGKTTFGEVHPDYLTELYGNRIGIEVGAKRSAQPIIEKAVDVLGVYTTASLPQFDSEFPSIRTRAGDDKLPPTLKPDADKVLLVVRVLFKMDATDTDKITRVSPGSVRLVARPAPGVDPKNYFPIGTVENGALLMASKPDDFLFVPADKAADFLFVIEAAALPDLTKLPMEIPAEQTLFIEAKRFARIDLGGKVIERLTPSDKVEVMRKDMVMKNVINSTPEAAKKRLVGKWQKTTVSGTRITLIYTDTTWREEAQVAAGMMVLEGTWKFIEGVDGLVIERASKSSGAPKRFKINFANDDTATMTDIADKSVSKITREK